MTKKCAHTDYERRVDESYNGCILCDNEILRGNLSLAEEGLASAMQEIGVLREELRKAVTGEICESCFEKGVADGTIRPRGSLEPLEPRGFVSDELFVIARDCPMSADTRRKLQALCPRIGGLEAFKMHAEKPEVDANLASRDAKSETAK